MPSLSTGMIAIPRLRPCGPALGMTTSVTQRPPTSRRAVPLGDDPLEPLGRQEERPERHDRQRHVLRPQLGYANALQEHAAYNLQEVANRVDYRQPLEDLRH